MKQYVSKILFLLFILAGNSLFAQSWKQLSKSGQSLMESGQYAKAAEAYDKAFHQKNSKKELKYKAAEAYLTAGNYSKAAEAFKAVSTEKDFPLAGFQYAKCLKSQGLYKTAKSAFKEYSDQYHHLIPGIKKQIENEIKGCNLALTQPVTDALPAATRLDAAVNSPANEYTPIPFDSGILYFTSTKSGNGQLYRSRLEKGSWSQAITPKLPKTNGQITQGSFSPDGTRFYFTICQNDRHTKDYYSTCDIYVVTRNGNQWSAPAALRQYIKMDGTTAMNPHIVQEGDIETLYFASDRPDGFGGMDLWYATRNINSDVYDFTFPVNLGKDINTPGDEVSPFYDQHSGQLYFSSNGHPSFGGMDIFHSFGKNESWAIPKNTGSDVNSTADDFGYTIESKSGEVFFVSNRSVADVNVKNTDIYTVGGSKNTLSISGKIIATDAASKDFHASLFEVTDDGVQRLLVAKDFSEATYNFDVLPSKKFRLVIEKNGFHSINYDFNTYSDAISNQVKDFQLMAAKTASTPRPSTTPSPTPPVVTTPVTSTPEPSTTTTTTTSPSSTSSTTSNKVYSGTYFKVQLTVVVDFDPYSPEYDAIRSYGNIDTEYLADRGWTRLLLSPFFSLKEAREMMKKARGMGYPEAFPVRYRDGKRMTP